MIMHTKTAFYDIIDKFHQLSQEEKLRLKILSKKALSKNGAKRYMRII